MAVRLYITDQMKEFLEETLWDHGLPGTGRAVIAEIGRLQQRRCGRTQKSHG